MLDRSHVCPHSYQQRILRGTWCTPELQKAVEKGYILHKIHKVWHFPPEQQDTGLFEGYVNTWLKLKQESAGWPGWCRTEEEKQQYLSNYRAREGIQLEYRNVKKNPGRKAIAKLMLNRYVSVVVGGETDSVAFLCSFWGKFGERLNKPRTTTIQQPSQLLSLLTNSTLNVNTLRICTDEVMEAVTTSIEENVNKGSKTDIFIAASTTCHARLTLYESLDLLQEQVLYYDTDSVIYLWEPRKPSVPVDDYLGCMTDELEGDVIQEFVSGGAKNYWYITHGGKVECKVRGFTLNVRGTAVLNYHTMKADILAELDDPQDKRRTILVKDPYFFQRDVPNKRIRLTERVKKYGLVFDKRAIDLPTKRSYPYGYSRIHHEVDLLLSL